MQGRDRARFLAFCLASLSWATPSASRMVADAMRSVPLNCTPTRRPSHKWQVHRRLRPECFAGRIETHAVGQRQYDIRADILQCDAVARVRSQQVTRLLPVAFAEGCPTHPSYPSAHACNAGACATILKAFFDADYVLPHPVEATPDGSTLDPWKGTDLTLGNEIDKLANNIALGRDAAGVHYRSDSIHGLFVGEQQALGLLRDYSRTYNEHFDGFVVRKFSGDRVKITGGEVLRYLKVGTGLRSYYFTLCERSSTIFSVSFPN
jgi:hypothetical protein